MIHPILSLVWLIGAPSFEAPAPTFEEAYQVANVVSAPAAPGDIKNVILPFPTLTVSVSPQGAAALKALTGKRIPGFQILGVVGTCHSDKACVLSGGDIYIAAGQSGIAYILPDIAASIVQTTVNRNWKKISVEVMKAAAVTGALVTSSGLVAAPAQVVSALILAHSAGDQLSGILQTRVPDPTALTSRLIDPERQLAIPAGGSFSGKIVAVYDKATKPLRILLQ